MLISHQHRFIFIKTYKTAGTSVEISLSRYLGPLDVITPLDAKDELIRARMGIYPRNHIICTAAQAPLPPALSDEEAIGCIEARQPRFSATPLVGHMAADLASRLVGEATWRDYLTFTVERHPMERLISLFFWEGGYEAHSSLAHFIRGLDYVGNERSYMIEGRVGVDRVLDYRDLAGELGRTLAAVGVNFDGWLPRAKANLRQDRRPWQEFMTAEEQTLARRKLAGDIAAYESLFGPI